MTSEPSAGLATQEDISFDRLTSKGHPGGLFQASMKAIRSAHFRSNRVRAALVVTGLFTDKAIYAAVVSIFYALTKELETKLSALKDRDAICKAIVALGYRFSEQYENDLAFLYGTDDWKDQVESLVQNNSAASSYRQNIRTTDSGEHLAGAAFVLWGALIIGGGAAAKPRIKARFGEEATHLFQDIAGPGREKRKSDFIKTWDSLATADTANGSTSTRFDEIVKATQECMQGNNDVLCSLAKNPWWLPYTIALAVGAVSVAVVFLRRSWYR